MKALVGLGEKITFKESDEIFEKAKTEFIYYMYSLAKEATDDEEEQSNICVNLSQKLGNLLGAQELRTILSDPEDYIANIPYAKEQNIHIEEVSES